MWPMRPRAAFALFLLLTLIFSVPAASLEQAAVKYARPQMLVDTAWLAAHVNDAGIRVVDMRPTGYASGHVPGAVHLANSAIRDAKNPPGFVPSPAAFESLMGRLGITNTMRVIAYDERGGLYAARLWWLLQYYGHANVALLDGGWTKWAGEGRPTSAEVPSVSATFTARPDPKWLATADDVLAAIKGGGTKIIDARTAGEIAGRDLRNIKRGGAIPSSISVYWEDGLNPDRTFKSAADLRALFESRGLRPADEVIAYCQVGMRASHDLFMLHLVGYDRLRHYYGAWEEWGNSDVLPIRK
jgi:thiosulfate/3-mercaptopyruvate sulfurtransferase